MTFKYNNCYIKDTFTIVGPYEKKGPLKEYFDLIHDDFYIGKKSWEDAESFLILESVKKLLKKANMKLEDVDLLISGDLLNQIVASNYAASKLDIPYLGIYSACATSIEGIIIGSNMIESKQINSCITVASSHNNAAEKQFRYPVEYGGIKPKSTTFTTTGGASICITCEKSHLRIESATIGRVIDMEQKNVYKMGAVMAPACAINLYEHLKQTNRTIDYYDMIYSGDLGKCGKEIFKDYMKEEYGIIMNNYDDTATMIYDLNKQDVYSGGSGPACLPLVSYSYILNKMRKGELSRVLLIGTGALMSTSMVNEKHSIPAIAHLVSLEVV